MQALSPRKKPKFFCSSMSIILYMNQNMQVLFVIFVAEIINNFVGKSIAFTDYIIFFEIFFVFRHAFVEKLEQRINSSLFKSLAFYKFNIYKD